MLGSVRRMGLILDLFHPEQPDLGVTEVAGALKISKSTAHELLLSLARIGILHRTPNRRFRLGWQILTLSKVLLDSAPWQDEARKRMEGLVARFGETAHLAALERGRVIYLEKLEGTRSVRVGVTAVGMQLPAHCSAVGKVLLAHQPWGETLKTIEEQGLPSLTGNTITSVDELRSVLIEVNKCGYAFDMEEAVPDICCVAAPIRNSTKEVFAAMSLSVPAYRFSTHRDLYRDAVLDATDAVSARLGYVKRTAVLDGRRDHHLPTEELSVSRSRLGS